MGGDGGFVSSTWQETLLLLRVISLSTLPCVYELLSSFLEQYCLFVDTRVGNCCLGIEGEERSKMPHEEHRVYLGNLERCVVDSRVGE